jgi:hypothetical protein
LQAAYTRLRPGHVELHSLGAGACGLGTWGLQPRYMGLQPVARMASVTEVTHREREAGEVWRRPGRGRLEDGLHLEELVEGEASEA